MISKIAGLLAAFSALIMAYVPDKLTTISFPGGNFLNNWSFEDGTSGWSSTGLNLTQGSECLWGKKSLKGLLTVAGTPGVLTQEISQGLGQYFEQKKVESLSNAPIRFSIQVKPLASSKFSVSIRGAITQTRVYEAVPQGGWNRLEVVSAGMLPDAGGNFSFQLTCYSNNEVLIDDALVELGQGDRFQDVTRSALFVSNSGTKIQTQGRIGNQVFYNKMRYDENQCGGTVYEYDPTSEANPLANFSFSTSQYEDGAGQGPSTAHYRTKAQNSDPIESAEHSDTQFQFTSPEIDGVAPQPGNPYIAARETKTITYLTSQVDLSPGTVGAELPKSNTNRGDAGFVEPVYSIQEILNNPNSSQINRIRTWSDAYGREVQSATVNSVGTGLLVTKREYDLEDNVTKTVPPKGNDFAQINVFEKYTRRLLSTSSPDQGTTEYRYLYSGLQKFVRDAKQKEEGVYTANVYDDLRRLAAIYVIKDQVGQSFGEAWTLTKSFPVGASVIGYPVKEYFYGWDINHADFGSRDCNLPGTGKYTLKNVFSKIYRVRIPDYSATQVNDMVDQYYSYDESGNISELITVTDNRVTLEKSEYALNGGVIRRRFFVCARSESLSQAQPISDVSYTYDQRGEVEEVFDNRSSPPTVVERFGHDIKGNLSALTYYPNNPNSVNETYAYNSLGWLKEKVIDHNSGRLVMEFNHEVDKQGNFTSRGDGRVTQISRYTIDDNSLPEDKEVSFKYDAIGQMNEVSSLDNLNSAKNGLLNMKYEFGSHGEITSVKKGADPKIDYEYNASSHQLKRLTGNLSAGRDLTRAEGNFEYYPNGLLKKDFSRNLLIKYDWRNMPIEMQYYTDRTYTRMAKMVSFVYNIEGVKISEIESVP